MRRVVLIVGMLAMTVPAAAQITDRGWTPGRRVPLIHADNALRRSPTPLVRSDLRGKIRDGLKTGTLSHCEARGFRRSVRVVEMLGRRYAPDGLTDSEAAELNLRAAVLGEHISMRRLGVTAAATPATRGRC